MKKSGSHENVGSGRRRVNNGTRLRELTGGQIDNLRPSQPSVKLVGDVVELEYIITPQKHIVWLTKQIKKALKTEA